MKKIIKSFEELWDWFGNSPKAKGNHRASWFSIKEFSLIKNFERHFKDSDGLSFGPVDMTTFSLHIWKKVTWLFLNPLTAGELFAEGFEFWLHCELNLIRLIIRILVLWTIPNCHLTFSQSSTYSYRISTYLALVSLRIFSPSKMKYKSFNEIRGDKRLFNSNLL